MDYYRSQPPMAGLSSALAMQGRMGDSTLVHMNPMEVEMLKTMSPDGSLSINPETGLPEAFKIKDIAAFALPIAATIAAPYLLPAIGVTGLSGVAAGAIGAGVGGFGAGLIQGKGVGDSLIQGGLSGLMSYGLGSAFAPATQTGPQALSGVPTAAAPSLSVAGTEAAAADVLAGAGMMAPSNITTASSMTGTPAVGITMMRPDAASLATLGQSATAAGLPAPGTPTSGFANIGLGPKDAVQYTGATDVYQTGTSETGLGQMFDRAGRTSPFGSTAFDGSQLGPTQLPTYTQIGGTALGSAGQMALEGMLSPEEMPYDIDGMADMDAYYNSRIPDLEAGRRRGRAAARGLNYPPSGGSAADYYGMATSPGGFGTFYAADGGQVPKPYGDPYGPGDAYGGVTDESNTSGTPGSESTSGSAGTSGLGSLGNSIDMGLGVANPSPIGIAASLAGLALGIPGLGPAVAIGRGISSMMGSSVPGQVSGFGTTTGGPTGIGIGVTGQAVDPNFEAVSGGYGGTGMGGEDSGSGDQGDTSVGHGAGEGTADGNPGEWATGGRTDLYGTGSIASLAYGGNPPTGYANQAFEGMVPGVGTGMSDDVPFSIEGDQPALLSRDEYVLPADVVSQLGDGSSGAGSDMLDNFISQVRQTKYGNTQQPAPVGPQLMTGLMRQGGIV